MVEKRKWRPGRDMVWLLVGVAGCVPRPRGIVWLHCFSCPYRLRTVRCTESSVKSQIYCPEHILAYESGKARYSLVMGFGSFRTDWLEAGTGGGLSTTLRPGLKCGSLESKFRRGPGTRDRSGTGWSRLCLGYKWGVYFSGYPAGHIDSRIAVYAWRYGLTALWHHSKNWHMKDGKIILIAQLLLDNRTCAYIEGWIMNLTWLLII
jgi:hypothetical protein